MTYSANNQELIPRGQQPVTVVIPEGQSNPPVNNVTVNINVTLFGGKLWVILIMAFLAYDWYFNGWAYTTAAKDFISSKLPQGAITQTYVPPDPILRGVDYRLVKVITRAQQLAPFTLDIRECHRNQKRQDKLFAQGYSWTQNSFHKTGHACDIGKLGVLPTDNKNSWKWAREINKYMQQAAKEQGVKLTWGGDWKATPDGFHWQVPRSTFVKPPNKVVQKPHQPPCVVPADINKQGVLDYVECRGERAGLPAGYMAVTAIIESGIDTRALNTRSQAAGLYQFIPSTAKEYGLKDPHNLVESTTAAIKYVKTFTGSQDAVTLYMQHNQGVCGYKIITEMASLGTADMVCGTNNDGDVTHDPIGIYKNIRGNTNGNYKRIIRTQGEFNRKSASAYINFMQKVYWPKGVRQWKTITSQW